MTEPGADRDHSGFTFTDENFRRRYAAEDRGADRPQSSPPPPIASGPRHLHGGGNSYRRARRRRLAAASG
jgi:hypothetical protein